MNTRIHEIMQQLANGNLSEEQGSELMSELMDNLMLEAQSSEMGLEAIQRMYDMTAKLEHLGFSEDQRYLNKEQLDVFRFGLKKAMDLFKLAKSHIKNLHDHECTCESPETVPTPPKATPRYS